MPERLPTDPDVFEAATWIATKDGISVDTAIERLERAARTAGLSPQELALQIMGDINATPGLGD